MVRLEHTYEVLYIVRPDVEEEEYAQVVSRYEQVIRDSGGSVIKVDEWGVRPFAYEIAHYKKGYYVLMTFSISPEALSALEEPFKLDDRVLRYQIVRQHERVHVPSQTAA